MHGAFLLNARAVRARWSKYKERYRDRYRELKLRSHEPWYCRLVDSYIFTLSVLGLLFTEYILFSQRYVYFYLWFSFCLPVMYLTKVVVYKARKMHYFLIDFCTSWQICAIYASTPATGRFSHVWCGVCGCIRRLLL